MMKIIRSLVVAALAAYAVPALAQPLVPGGGAPMVPSGGSGGGGSGGTISPGTSGQVAAYTASTVIGGISNTALTALINPATASLSGALPAWPNTTTTFFRGDGTYQTLNPAALGCATANGIIFNNATPCDTGLSYAGSGGAINYATNNFIQQDTAGILALTQGAALSGTVTLPSAWEAINAASSSKANLEYMQFGFAAHSNIAAIDVNKAGTGTVRAFGIYTGGTPRFDFGASAANTATIGATVLDVLSGANHIFTVNSGGGATIAVGSNYAYGWTTTANASQAAMDTFLTRSAPASLQHGAADAAAPVAQIIKHQSVVAGTNNTAGVSTTYIGSLGTGTGGSGKIIMEVGLTGTTGTVQNSPFPLLSLNPGSATTATVQFGDGTNFTTYDSCTALTTGATGIIACTASAIRFKELYKAVPLNIAGLADLRTNVPWRYREDAGHGLDPSRIHIGLLADDVEKLDRRCAVYHKDDPRPSDYEDRCVIAYLVAARKADHDEFDAYRRAHP